MVMVMFMVVLMFNETGTYIALQSPDVVNLSTDPLSLSFYARVLESILSCV